MTENRLKLTGPQSRIFLSPARMRIAVAGRRFGKTFLGKVELGKVAVNQPGSASWYVAPTYHQAESILWEKLKEFFPRSYIRDKDETDLTLILKNKSLIALRGSDKPDSLRGPGLDFLVSDESAFQKKNVWGILRPMLSDTNGRALIISTPFGYNHFYDQYVKAKGRPNWETFHFTTLEGGNVSPEEIEEAKSELDERTFRQEYEASFEALTGRVYYAYDREVNAKPLLDIANVPLLVGMDFNVDPMTAALAIRSGDQIQFIGEIVMRDGNTELMAQTIRNKYPGRVIRVYPDPTGNARKTSAPVGQTDFTILRRFGFQVLAPSHPYMVADKINTVNAAFRNAKAVSRCFIDSARCPQLAKACDGLTYREGTNEPDKSLGLDHITDAMAYLLCWELPMRESMRRVEVSFA